MPKDREALEELPGVGRKTANVVLNVAFGEPTIAVDTHIFRVSNRTGLAPGKDVLEVELALEKLVPEQYKLPRPSLADPARPLYLRRAQAACARPVWCATCAASRTRPRNCRRKSRRAPKTGYRRLRWRRLARR